MSVQMIEVKFAEFTVDGGAVFALDTNGRIWRYGPPEQIGANTLAGGKSEPKWKCLQCLLEFDK